MRTWLPLTLSQTNSTANGTIRSSREKRKRVSRDSAEVVQVILRRPLSASQSKDLIALQRVGFFGIAVRIQAAALEQPDDPAAIKAVTRATSASSGGGKR